MTAAPDQNKKRRYRPLITLALLVLLASATLALLPLGIDYGLKEWIRQHGGEQVSVANVDFNPFTATLRLDKLRITNRGENQLTLPRLDLQLAWRPLFSRQLVVTGLDLSGVVVKLVQDGEQNQLQIGGVRLPMTGEEAPDNSPPWAVHLDRIGLRDTLIEYQGPEFASRLRIETMNLTGIASDNKSGVAGLELAGSIDRAEVKLKGQFTPFADVPGFEGTLRVESLALNNYARLTAPHLSRLEGDLSLDGAISLRLPPSATPGISHEGHMELTDYRIADPEREIAGDRIAWEGRLSRETGTLGLAGQLNSGAIHVTTGEGATSYSHRDLAWEGDLILQPGPTGRHLLDSSRLTIRAPEIQLPERRLTARQIDMSLKKATLALSGKALTAHLPGSLELTDLYLTTDSQRLLNERLQWEGTAQFNRQDAKTTVVLDGQLKEGPAQLELLPEQASIGLHNLVWQGGLEIAQDQQGARILPAGNLTANGLEAIDQRAGLRLLTLEQLDIDQLAGNSEEAFTAARIGVRTITAGAALPGAGDEPEAMLSLDELRIRQPEFSANHGLRIQQIETSGLQQRVVRLADNKLNLQRLTAALAHITGGSAQETDAPASQPLPITIGQLTLHGESLLSFEDQTTDPVYRLQLKPELFSMQGISNTPADRAAPVRLKGILDKSTTLDLDGELALFASQPTFSLKGRIEGLELPPLSAYTIPLLGYRLQSGKANSDLRFVARAGQIDGNSDLTLNQLEVEPLDSEKMAALQQQLSIPLETALGMLKDKHNQIRLNLPVTGAVDDIQVDPSDAINQAIGRAVKKGAKTYLATALFPFGTLLTLVELAGDSAAKIQLDPIPFDPGSSRLRNDQHAYLDKIAQLLNDRPEVYIRLCGVATAGDIEALKLAEHKRDREAAEKGEKTAEKTEKESAPAAVGISRQQQEQLASDRATSIEHYLSKTHRIKAERLISCQPKAEPTEKKSAPRVDLLI